MRITVVFTSSLCIVTLLLASFVNAGAALDEENQVDVAPRIDVKLKAAIFDPLYEEPGIPPGLVYSEENPYYLVQCKGPIQGSWLSDMTGLGGIILGYVPDYTYIIHMEGHVRSQVARLPFVRWVGMYHPAYKIEPGLMTGQGKIQLNVMVFREPDTFRNIDIVSEKITALNGRIIGSDTDSVIIQAIVDATIIRDIAFIPEVEWIDEYSTPVAAMDNIRVFTGAESPLHEFGFTGNGIVGEVKDSGIDEDHVEFENTLNDTDGNVDEDSHGTSTFGIVFAQGVDERAKGMLPTGQGIFCDWGVGRKASIANLVNNWGGLFQSNSWHSGSTDGAYASNTRQNDEAVFEHDVSMLYASGNGGGDATMSREATAKNVIAVGALNHYNNQDRTDDLHNGNQGNKGPTADGRIKPDVVGPYDSIYTTTSGGGYTSTFGGTSGATPVAAGAVGLIYEMYLENHFRNNPSGTTPHASTIKAILIADAYQYEFSQGDRYAQGWGLVDVGNVYFLGENHLIDDESVSLKTGESTSYKIRPTGIHPLKIALVWTDVPGTTSSSQHLINDLNLKVTDPQGTVYWGNVGLETSKWSSSGGGEDTLNNVENVFIESPSSEEWTIEVSAANVAMDGNPQTGDIDQSFALVASGVIGVDHDMAISDMEVPRYFEVFKEAQVPGTVSNIGLQDEQNVVVNLLEDGAVVDTQIISSVQSGSSAPVSLSWVPTAERTSEVTIEIVPVDGEDREFNNQMSRSVDIFAPKGFVLVDTGHGNAGSFGDFLEYLYSIKYPYTTTSNALTPGILDQHNVLITAGATSAYDSAELSSIDDFVKNGGGLFVVGDNDLSVYNDLTSHAGITWATPRGVGGTIDDIVDHNITDGVDQVYMDSPNLVLEVESPAQAIAYDNDIVLSRPLIAVSEYGDGRLAALTDDNCLDDGNLDSSDNRVFGENAVEWLNINMPPTAVIDSPLDGSSHSSINEVLFDGVSSHDPDGYITDYAWISDVEGALGNTVSFSRQLTAGTHTISLMVTDNLGKTSSTSVVVSIIEPVPPSVTIDSPGDGQDVHGLVVISGSASDVDGVVEEVEIRIDGGDPYLATGTAQWQFEWNTTFFEDGSRTITVMARDDDDLYSDTASMTLNVDNSPPNLLSGPTATTTDTTATIQWETDEPGNCIVEYGTDPGYGDVETKSQYVKEHSIVLRYLLPGTTYYFRVITIDSMGNMRIVAENKIFTTAPPPDRAPPEGGITSPSDGETLKGVVPVKVDVSDDSGIDSAEFYVNNVLKFTDEDPAFTWLWDTADGRYPDGQYVIKAVVRDTLNNKATFEITVTLDNEIIPPAIDRKKASPNSMDNVRSTDVLITVEIYDPEDAVQSVTVDLSSLGKSPKQFMYDDGTHGDEVPLDGIYSYQVTVRPGTEEGEKTLAISVLYGEGETVESEVALYIIAGETDESTEDKGSASALEQDLLWLLLIIVIITAVAMGGMGLVVSRKNKKRNTFQAVEPMYAPQYYRRY